MVKRAIRHGIRFDYLLADSWFSNARLMKFIRSRHIGCNYLGMIKINAKTKYTYEGMAMTANEIMAKIKKERRKERKVKYCRTMRYHYASANVVYQGMNLMLFFYKTGRKEGWNALITTDLSLGAKDAYRIYSMRWAIEVVFADMKRLLLFGKNQSRDFTAQIGSVTLSCMQYNILSCVKRFESYETMGGLFGKLYMAGHELSVTERIWGLMVESLSIIASRLDWDVEDLIELIIDQTDNEALSDFIESSRKLALLTA